MIEYLDFSAMLKVSQQDPEIADRIIEDYSRTCKPDVKNPR